MQAGADTGFFKTGGLDPRYAKSRGGGGVLSALGTIRKGGVGMGGAVRFRHDPKSERGVAA